MKKKITGLLLCGLLYAGCGLCNDLDAFPAAGGGQQAEWDFSVMPYFWAAGLSGKVSHSNSPVIDIDASFDKIFDNLDFAAMLMGDARKGRYSIFGDLIYIKIGSQGDTPHGILATSAEVQTSTFAGLIGAGYSVLQNSPHRLDVVAGVRVWSVDTDITLKGAHLAGRKHSDGATWVDGLIGLRGNYVLTPKLYVTGWGLIGAGGAEAEWDVGLGIGYSISKNISASLGYRALGVDYSHKGFEFDAVLQGPMAGVTIRF